MTSTIVAIGFCVLIIILGKLLTSNATPRPSAPHPRRPLLSNAELLFFRALRDNADARFTLFTKVRLADLILVHSSDRDFMATAMKHIDFVVCEGPSLDVCLAVELDDSSPNTAKAKRRDDFVDAHLKAAGIPIHRVKVSSSYSRDIFVQLGVISPTSDSDARFRPRTTVKA